MSGNVLVRHNTRTPYLSERDQGHGRGCKRSCCEASGNIFHLSASPAQINRSNIYFSMRQDNNKSQRAPFTFQINEWDNPVCLTCTSRIKVADASPKCTCFITQIFTSFPLSLSLSLCFFFSGPFLGLTLSLSFPNSSRCLFLYTEVGGRGQGRNNKRKGRCGG